MGLIVATVVGDSAGAVASVVGEIAPMVVLTGAIGLNTVKVDSEVVASGLVNVLFVRLDVSVVVLRGVTNGENRVGEIDATTIGATLITPTKLTCRGANGSNKVPLPMLPVPINMRL